MKLSLAVPACAALEDRPIAFDAIAVIVNPRNKVRNLTGEQVKATFTGTVTNWKKVGGEDRQVVDGEPRCCSSPRSRYTSSRGGRETGIRRRSCSGREPSRR